MTVNIEVSGTSFKYPNMTVNIEVSGTSFKGLISIQI